MQINISQDAKQLGRVAGAAAAQSIRDAIETNGSANIILATGTSQFETLKQLIIEPGIDWAKVVIFHLDEYIGLPITHPASFRKYLVDRFISKVHGIRAVHLINGEANPQAECERLNRLIIEYPIAVALVGIGENGHLAFNDPPADFQVEDPYIIVTLDEECKKQQFGEGWFKSIDEVPKQAISMSIKQILKSQKIICSVPDGRKASATKNALERPVSNRCPASVLQIHRNCTIYLDTSSASLLTSKELQFD